MGGDTVRQTVNNILKKLFTRDMALQYSLKGKQKKKAFYKLKLHQVIIGMFIIHLRKCNLLYSEIKQRT